MKPKLLLLIIVAVFSVSIIGCSNHVGLSGKVVYSDNGEPVTSGEVQLNTPTFFARAPIREDGTFRAGSYKDGDGLPPGTYGVAVVSVDPGGNTLIDLKFSDAKTSGLSVTIETTTREFEITVDRPPAVQTHRR